MKRREAWRERAPELLGDIADAAAGVLREAAGMEEERAQHLGYHIMRAIADACGGTQVYLQRADSIERCERDEAMKRREAWRERAQGLLGDIADAAAGVLRDAAGMEEERAQSLGYHIMRAIADACGSAQVYLPKADVIKRCERDEAIWRDFDGFNYRELARRYGVSEIYIYRVIKRMRALDSSSRNGALDL